MTAEATPRPVIRLAFRAYRVVLSPILHALSPTQCKFLPTCSEYAYVSLARHGILRGTILALNRIIRCHPWARGGLDPVPPVTTPGPNNLNHLSSKMGESSEPRSRVNKPLHR